MLGRSSWYVAHVEVSVRSSKKVIAKKEHIRRKAIAFRRVRSFSAFAFPVLLMITFGRIRSFLAIAFYVFLKRIQKVHLDIIFSERTSQHLFAASFSKSDKTVLKCTIFYRNSIASAKVNTGKKFSVVLYENIII